MDLRAKLWKLLGGTVDERGRPASEPDAWEDLLTASREEAERVVRELAALGMEARHVQDRIVHHEPATRQGTLVQVRHRDADHARRLLRSGAVGFLGDLA